MKNQSNKEMLLELKSSRPKMFFMIFLAVGGVASIFTGSFEVPDFQAEHINVSYKRMMKQIYLSGLTSAQQDKKKSDFVGKRVTWKATVIDVVPGSWGNKISLSDGARRGLTDYFLERVPDKRALTLSKDDTVHFTATIDKFSDGMLTGYVHLSGAEFK